MAEITLYNARKVLLAGGVIQIEQIYTGGHKKSFKNFFKQKRLKWRVLKDITVRLSNDEVITIPAGFETDLCSTPRIIWWWLAPYGDFLLAYIIHDWLYVHIYQDRYFADKEMLKWACAIFDNMKDNIIRYHGVRLGGESWWQSNVRRIQREQAGI